MADLLRKIFCREENLNKEYKIQDFDDTFSIPLAALKLVGIRLTRNDSAYVRLCWNLFYWFEFANLFIVTWLELINMVETGRGGSFQDAIEIFRMMPCVGYLLLAMAKSYKIVYYRPVYENLINELRSMWPKGSVSEEEHHIISTAQKHLRYVTKGYYWCNNALLVIFLSPPFAEVFKRSLGYDVPLILPFFYWFPFDPFQRVYYEIILVFQTWHGLITIWFMMSCDLLFCIFLSHITTQFDLLSVRIRRLVYVPVDEQLIETYPLGLMSPKIVRGCGCTICGTTSINANLFGRSPSYNYDRTSRTGEFSETYLKHNTQKLQSFDNNDWYKQHEKDLTEIILRHRALIRLSGDVEDMFSFALLVNFFNSSIIICFCGFCCVVVEKWNEMVYKSFLTTALSQTWLLCWYGQRLLESSEGVSDALYNSGWYKTSENIKHSILIMLHRTQKNVRVTTYGFSVISLASYTTIIKTAWSYFTLLLNIYKQ